MTTLSNIITPSNVLTTTNTATVTNKTLTSPTVTGMVVSDGTANGVTYLNGSKVLTSGSALTFNGTNFVVVGSGTFTNSAGTPVRLQIESGANDFASIYADTASAYKDLVLQRYGGSLGLGVIPSAWSSGYKAIQFGPQGSIANDSTNEGFISYGVNFYRNASAQWTYIQTAPATKLTQYGGEFQFLAAPSGTAGTAITWTQILSASKGKTFALEGASSTTGTGIAFPATQSASSDANTLDDYEEGTWTPTVTPQTGSLTSYTATASYTKIGRQVFLQGKITITSAGTATGVANIGAIPFQTSGTYYPTGLVIETAATGTMYSMYLNPSNTIGVIAGLTGAGGPSWLNGYTYNFNITYTI